MVQSRLLTHGASIYVTRDPYKYHKVFDSYRHSLKKRTVRHDHYDLSRWLRLSGPVYQFDKEVHDLGLKAVVLVDESIDVKAGLGRKLKRHYDNRQEIRLIDRIRTVFPGIL